MLASLRLALRGLGRAPGFALAATLCIALGIGASTAVFSALDAVLLRPLDVPALDRLVVVRQDLPTLGLVDGDLGPPESAEVLARADLFDAGAAIHPRQFNLVSEEGAPLRVGGARTFGDFFALFGHTPALGRYYVPDASRDGARVAVISHDFWQERYGGDPAVLGRTIQLSGTAYEIVGVAAPTLRFPRTAEVWVPYPIDSSFAAQRGRMYMTVVGRLRPGVTPERLTAQLALETRRWEGAHDAYGRTGLALHARPLATHLAGDLRAVLLALLGAVGLVLLIACANVACLQLVRAAGRARELAVRTALGAARRQLVAPLAAESAVLAALGGALGLALGAGAVAALRAFGPARYPQLQTAQLDGPVLAGSLGATVLAALLFGVAPAVRALRVAPQGAMREGASRNASRGRAQHRALHAAVVAQVAIALTLVLGAGVVSRGLVRLVAVDPGFRAEQLVGAHVALARDAFPTPERMQGFYDGVLARLRATPGLADAAVVSFLPFGGEPDNSPFQVVGRAAPADGEQPHANYNIVSPGFFRTMGVTLVRGRDFAPADRIGAPAVAIVDEQLARQYFPGEDPIGRRISQMGDLEIVGVVRSVKQAALGAPDKATIYYPITQMASGTAALVVRSTLPDAAVERLLRAAVAEEARTVPVYDVKSLPARVAESLGARRLAATVFGVFAALALTLAVLGIYGVLSYVVAQRTRELGIRAAIGAGRGRLAALVLGSGARLTAAGLAIGAVAFLALGRTLEALVYGVGPRDPVTLVGGVALLGAAALVACWIPARRAARVAPAVALQAE
jgi:predicted permease